ncbi:hypothetical protein [Streptomyces sp. NPDC059063]|uniref:hypothetical protein n=1 Tax=unclassified Streptomyces TaxID=2593676 RepID=UPI0036ABEE80
MTDCDTYGTNTHTPSELARLVTGHLDVAFAERDSGYRGVYYLADLGGGSIEIQPNAIPGDDGRHDLYAPEPPTIQVLLLSTAPTPEPSVRARLCAIEGLVHLGRETW